MHSSIMKIEVLVKRTGCKKTEVLLENKGVLELNIKGRPENGEANLEIIRFFSRMYKRPARIIKGFKSKRKVIEI